MTRKTLPMIIVLSMTSYLARAYGYCAPDNVSTSSITGGTKTRTDCAYVAPNCNEECECCYSSPTYSCKCNSGYHVVYKSDDCSCVKNCSDGYYGNGATCTRCPTPGTTSGYTTQISGCYIPANTPLMDSSGTYLYTSNCKYTN